MLSHTPPRPRSIVRRAPLLVALLLVGLGLISSACDTEDPGVSVSENIPASPDPNDPSLPPTLLTGTVLDWTDNSRIPDAVVSSNPETDKVRATAQGQFVLQNNLTGGEPYEVIAEAEGYAKGSSAVVAQDEQSRNVDILLIPSDIASDLVLDPGAVVFTETTRQATLFVENPSNNAIRWELRDADRPNWLVPSSTSGTAYTGNPEVMEFLVRGDLLTGSEPITERITFYDQDDRIFLLTVTAYPHDASRLQISPEAGATTSASSGDEIVVPTRVLYDGEPVAGERVECTVNAPSAAVDIPVYAVTDANGVANCTFTAETSGDLSVQVLLASYPSVSGFEAVVTVQ